VVLGIIGGAFVRRVYNSIKSAAVDGKRRNKMFRTTFYVNVFGGVRMKNWIY